MATLLGRLGAAAALAAAPSLWHTETASSQPPPHAETGRVTGSVLLAPSLASRNARLRVYGGYGPRSAAAASVAGSESRNVVVYLESVPWTASGVDSAAERPALRQVSEEFLPHTLPVLNGSTVTFPNDDPIFHNVFSLSRTRTFDLGRYPKGASKSVTFDKPGIVQVFCHIHSDMNAIVLVLANPFFAVPGDDGRFAIDDIPVGDYRIVAWHERTRPVVQEVRVRAGQTSAVTFRLPGGTIASPAR